MGKIYEVYERNGIVYFLNENKEIEFYYIYTSFIVFKIKENNILKLSQNF